MSYGGTVVNIDPNLPKFFMDRLNGDFSDFEEKAKAYVELYWNKGITDLLFCIFEQSSITESEIFSSRADKYDVKLENGIEVDYTGKENIYYHKWLKDNNIDIFDIWIKHTRKSGINPWLSFRMNDAHFHGEKTSFLRSDFYYKAADNGWMIGEECAGNSYFGECFDYAVPEVFNKMLAYIAEQTLRYDVYGIELDFIREIACLDYKKNPDCHLIMNRFMAEIKKITDRAAEKHGHPVKIAVRLTRDIEESRKYGFDALQWAKDGNVDVIVPSPRWATTDSDMPIDKWCEALEPYGAEVWACVELNLNFWMGLRNNIETVKGFIVQYASLGSKKGYLYNYFVIDNLDIYNSLNFNSENYNSKAEGSELVKLWRTCSNLESARKGVRRHVMTQQDDSEGFAAPGWRPLPKEIDGKAHFDILTGEILKNEKAVLYVGLDGGDVSVSINGAELAGVPDTDGAYVHTSEKLECENIYAFEFTADESLKRQSVDIEGKCTVKYLEIKVTAE